MYDGQFHPACHRPTALRRTAGRVADRRRVVSLARGLRSVSVRDNLALLQEAAAARRDSACRDLARELATLRSAA
jgi:hypothetical protein